MCLLSYVLKIDAFSSSPVVSALRSSASALCQQVLDVDDHDNNSSDNINNNSGGQQEPPRPFFFTGEAKSDSENRELQRVFLGAESLRSSADNTIEQEAAAYMKDSIAEDGTSDHVVNFDQERENLERLFHM